MTNEEIIVKAIIDSGKYTEEEIQELIESGKEIPVHTLKGWTSRGKYKVKPGEHGIETKLWKKNRAVSGKKQNDNEKPEKEFYLAKAFLFTADQVELQED